MNELIKQLAHRAWVDNDKLDACGYTDLQKFAELIVEECIGIVENLSPGYADYRNQIEDAFRRDCVEKVKEHFGVE
jgi:hypothetical protein